MSDTPDPVYQKNAKFEWGKAAAWTLMPRIFLGALGNLGHQDDDLPETFNDYLADGKIAPLVQVSINAYCDMRRQALLLQAAQERAYQMRSLLARDIPAVVSELESVCQAVERYIEAQRAEIDADRAVLLAVVERAKEVEAERAARAARREELHAQLTRP